MRHILERAREIIADERNYIPGGDAVHAVDAGGKTCAPGDEAALKWTLRGAVRKACDEKRAGDAVFRDATNRLLHCAARRASGMSDHKVALTLLSKEIENAI